jgi:hypothetical protein
MEIEMVHPVTEVDDELAAVATPGGRIIVGVDDSPGGRAALRGALCRCGGVMTVAYASLRSHTLDHGLGPLHV